jgi:hypothetical protein
VRSDRFFLASGGTRAGPLPDSGQTAAYRIRSSITILPQHVEFSISLCPADIWLSTKTDQLFDDALIDMNSSFYSISFFQNQPV